MTFDEVDKILKQEGFHSTVLGRYENEYKPLIYKNDDFITIVLDHETETFVIQFNLSIWGECKYMPMSWSFIGSKAFDLALDRMERAKSRLQRMLDREFKEFCNNAGHAL